MGANYQLILKEFEGFKHIEEKDNYVPICLIIYAWIFLAILDSITQNWSLHIPDERRRQRDAKVAESVQVTIIFLPL
jgi:hypothetical protein